MTGIATGGTLMTDVLTNEALDLIVFADDCKCTSLHTAPENYECSGEVTHYRSTCTIWGLVCANGARYIQWGMEVGRCMDCGRNADECWKVIPV
jgi:hypothetical protein